MTATLPRFKVFEAGTHKRLQPLLKEMLTALIYDVTRSSKAYLEAKLEKAELELDPSVQKEALVLAILDEITLGLHQFFDLSDVGVLLVDYEGKEYRSIARQGIFIEPLKPGVYRQPFGVGLIGRSHKLGQTVLINDTTREPDMYHVPGVPILSELLVPIKYAIPGVFPRVLAIFDIGNNKKNAFDQQQQALVETVAACLAPVLYDPSQYLSQIEPHINAADPEWDALVRTLSFTNTYLTASRRRASMQISQAAGSLAVVASNQATKAEEQADQIEQTALAAQELGVAVQQVAVETHQLSLLGQITTRQVSVSQAKVAKAVEAMQQLAGTANLNETISQNLIKQLAEIGRVGSLLEEISDDTGLLALNATIEAAGEPLLGQRFGVVASEVRGLAERIKRESRYISNLLRGVKSQSQELQASNAQIGTGISQLSQQLDEASTTLQEALNLVQQTKAGIQSVEQLTQLQKERGVVIAAAMQEARQLTQLIAREETELAISVGRLKEIAARIGS